jgi:DNA-binding transcriptional MerR regulator
MDDVKLTIGQVAERAGLNVSAIRYYESQGCFPRPSASQANGASPRRR